MEVHNGEEHYEMSVDEAKKILEEDTHHKKELIDNVYPWWATMKWPLMLISVALIVLCTSVVFLAVTMKVLANDREEEFEIDACYDAFTSDSSQATARVRAAATRVDNAGWNALVNSVGGVEVTQEVVDEVEALIKASNDALAEDQASINRRDAWVDEGQPLPCPVRH